MLGHPAFLLLWRLKLRAGVRAQFRKLKRPRNWLFLLIGLVIFLPWILSLFFTAASGAQPWSLSPAASEALSGLGILMLLLLSIVGAFQVRGLYLAKEEIELAFTAPVPRADLVRYRMLSNVTRSLFGGLLFGMGLARRMPEPMFGFLMAIVIMLTVPLVSQATSLLLGGAENRFAKRMQGWPGRLLMIALLIAFLVPFIQFLTHPERLQGMLGGSVETWLSSPVLHAVLLPLSPWIRALHASSWLQFLPWLAVCIAVWFVLFELTARIRLDYRELSLATSANFAARIARMRKGGGAIGSVAVEKQTAGWNVPWLFGRGPFGAIAWLKLATIVRKARGTLLFSAGALLLVTLLFSLTVGRHGSMEQILGGAALIVLLGSLYLAAGLRFDFRQDMDIMGEIKSWPLPAWQVFLATILPQVALITLLLWIAIVLRSAFVGFHPWLVAVLLIQPFLTYLWSAIDNGAHLLSPVRYSPGQEGALQNLGRAVILSIGRLLSLVLLLACVGLPALLAWLAWKQLGMAAWLAVVLGGSFSLLIFVGVAVLVTFLGGKLLQRFDVARDRG